MASGGSSGGTSSRSSGSEEEFQIIMDQKKRKRMISNRESARRSRMKKQKHMDELTSEIARFKNESSQIITAMNATAQLYVKIEAENSVLRAQAAELSHRLQSLNEIIDISSAATAGSGGFWGSPAAEPIHDGFFNSSWNDAFVNSQLPLMASVDMFDGSW